jgi:Subtilase family
MRIVSVANRDTCASYVNAVRRAVKAGVSVINMSYGWDLFYECPQHTVATNYAFSKGVVLVAAAGNDSSTGSNLQIPGHDAHVLTVGGVTSTMTRTPFTNFFYTDIVAPATDIVTAVPPALDHDGNADGYTAVIGTSFAAPIVAAAAAWIAAARPELTNSQVHGLLERTANDLGPPGWDDTYGWGFIDIAEALRADPPPPDPSEVNDNIEWVNGRRLGKRRKPVFRPGDSRTEVAATLDDWDDAADVYRVVLPPRSSVRCSVILRPLRPQFPWLRGDVDIQIYGPKEKSIYGNLSGRRPGRSSDDVRRLAPLFDPGRGRWSATRVGPDWVRFWNDSRRRRTFYVAAYIPTRAEPSKIRVDASYELEFGKLRAVRG